jgi:hypothetical protein
MRFQTVNALHLFQFKEVTIKEIAKREDSLTVVMDALIVKGNNPVNEECVDRFADIANVRFLEGTITEILKEGYKYYDANNNLLEEKADVVLPETEYDTILKACTDCYLYDLIAVKETEGGYEYQLGVDINDEDTYWISIQCKETIVEWEKFKNRVTQ